MGDFTFDRRLLRFGCRVMSCLLRFPDDIIESLLEDIDLDTLLSFVFVAALLDYLETSWTGGSSRAPLVHTGRVKLSCFSFMRNFSALTLVWVARNVQIIIWQVLFVPLLLPISFMFSLGVYEQFTRFLGVFAGLLVRLTHARRLLPCSFQLNVSRRWVLLSFISSSFWHRCFAPWNLGCPPLLLTIAYRKPGLRLGGIWAKIGFWLMLTCCLSLGFLNRQHAAVVLLPEVSHAGELAEPQLAPQLKSLGRGVNHVDDVNADQRE